MIELLIYPLIRVSVISVRYFCLIKDLLCNLYGLPQKKSNVHLLYSFICFFIHNSITKYYWQDFAKPLGKAFRKTSNGGYCQQIDRASCLGCQCQYHNITVKQCKISYNILISIIGIVKLKPADFPFESSN